MELTNNNYYSLEANMEYMSCSQFKDFLKCEREALAKLIGATEEEQSDALLFGGYIDAYFSGELDEYVVAHPEMINTRTNELKAPFKNINEVISAIENDEVLLSYLQGKHQVIMTGEIAGVKFKVKIDSLFEDKIVDQKVMKDMNLLWVERDGRNVKTDFVDAYGYDIQGAIYQEIVRQNIGKQLPFILAVATKEESPDKALIQIDQEYLDKALDLVKELAPHFDLVKQGLCVPTGCNHCPTCRKTHKVTGVVSYKELFNKKDTESEETNE